MSARIRTLIATLVLGVLLGCTSPDGDGAGTEPRGGERARPASAAKSPFWVDPGSPAARQVQAYKQQGRAEDAALLERIASRPVAAWPPGHDPGADVRAAVRGAAAGGRTAVLVAYNIPHRDCGQHSAGGAADAAAYERWIGSFADGIGDGKAVVILEPDAVPHVVDGCTPPEMHEERFRLISGAIAELKRHPGVRVYLDAGNSAWITDPGKLAHALRRAGVGAADGFALNVSNFRRTDEQLAYGRRLSELLDGAHFVVDTSRNGNGPLPGAPNEVWCNPPGRALGEPPTTRTGDERADAFLWVKRPGESDGPCRGGPEAGTWWPDYALGLARRAG
ncbi:glycoside hydrolase family 6 protein [Streptomyces sp. WMMC500]|uniref:glycoside hydrolase family 6 protein n=1 Tax=Streptomyces sp. WMMC500 TaxID=3015154 RepID=UPI00248CA6F1|nr:glycoside hydrolase family 6 protein [Streptomyces sp. WMMC500]WBB62986.1 glycoside hydrolase family 6 protein [Streptomyces sp. WMMC500]